MLWDYLCPVVAFFDMERRRRTTGRRVRVKALLGVRAGMWEVGKDGRAVCVGERRWDVHGLEAGEGGGWWGDVVGGASERVGELVGERWWRGERVAAVAAFGAEGLLLRLDRKQERVLVMIKLSW